MGPAPPPEPGGADAEPDPRSEAERQADQAAAKAAVLTIDDFDGFKAFAEPWQALGSGDDQAQGDDETADAADEDDPGGDILAEVAACLGVQGGLFGDDDPQATSPTFQAPDSVIVPFVGTQVTYTAADENVVRGLDILRRDQAPRCLETVIEESLVAPGEEVPSDVEFGETTAEELTLTDLGDESVAFQVVTPVSPVQSTGPALDEFGVDLFAELRVVRVGRVAITMFLQSQVAEFPSEEAERLTRLVVDRISAEATAGDDAELATE